MQSYVDAGIDPAQLGLGLAMYGRGWTGATSSEPWGTATGAASGQWEAGINDYDVIKNVGTGHYDAELGAAWRHDGNTWWSYDNDAVGDGQGPVHPGAGPGRGHVVGPVG